MSKQNKDEWKREDWINKRKPAPAFSDNDPATPSPDEEWEKRALRGRDLLGDESEAEALLTEVDKAIDAGYSGHAEAASASSEKPRRIWWRLAAAILVLIVAAWWVFAGKEDSQALYKAYFTHLDNELSVTLMGMPDTSMLAVSLRPYNARRYAEATKRLKEYLDEYDAPPTLRLYYGISLMESGRADEAIAEFEWLRENLPPREYPPATDWYLSLALLKERRIREAKALLASMSGAEQPYAAKAAELLRKL